MAKKLRQHETIELMKGRPAFNYISIIRDSIVQELSVEQRLDMCPKVKRDFAVWLITKYLRKQTRPSIVTKKIATLKPLPPNLAEAVWTAARYQVDRVLRPMRGQNLMPMGEETFSKVLNLGEADIVEVACLGGEQKVQKVKELISDKSNADDSGLVVNFYRIAKVVGMNQKLRKVLVDAGTVLEVIPEYIADTMKLVMHPTMNLMVHTATSNYTRIKSYVVLNIKCFGVS